MTRRSGNKLRLTRDVYCANLSNEKSSLVGDGVSAAEHVSRAAKSASRDRRVFIVECFHWKIIVDSVRLVLNENFGLN